MRGSAVIIRIKCSPGILRLILDIRGEEYQEKRWNNTARADIRGREIARTALDPRMTLKQSTKELCSQSLRLLS